jgi:hypothetical protein
MDVPLTSALAPFLALAAMLLGISLLVQVLQELWKFSTSSKATAFEKTLDDFLGPWATQHLRQNTAMAVRGPLQFRRVSSAGRILPADKGDLMAALEQAAPAWHRVLDSAMSFEATLQAGTPNEPSPRLRKLLDDLEHEVAGPRPTPQAQEVRKFLDTWGVSPGSIFDAVQARTALRDQFFGHLSAVEMHYDRLIQNFQYAYQRRNLRQTFTIALVVALAFNLPLGDIYRRAAAMPIAEAVALSARAQALNAELQKLSAEKPGDTAQAEQLKQLAQREANLRRVAEEAFDISAGRSLETNVRALWASFRANLRAPAALIGCLLTAVLVSFGAPFWNDVSAALYRAAKPAAARREDQGASA